MWKAVLAGTAAVAIVGTSLVYAQQRPRGPEGGQRWQISQEDAAAFADARIAALKAGLRLTPEQEKNWASYETALRDMAKARRDRMTAQPNEQRQTEQRQNQNEPRPADPVERLRRQAEALSGAGARLKSLADAQEPLYKSLDDGQKRRFHVLSQMLRPRHPHMAMRGHQGQGPQGGTEGRGMDRPDGGPHGPAPQGRGAPRGGREG
jgi:zinc resistance-associated protein